MSISVKRAGQYIELEFTGAEILETYGRRDELYGDGTITLTLDEAIKLAKELLEVALEEEEEEGETT
jgi:20S proteasome alpha/beta subunit